jgi:acyl-CoA synthetase (AMP-forming)/AMP-acid ligase II/aryl carrier-like protein
LLQDWLLAQNITISFVPTVLAEQLLYVQWPTGTRLRTLLTGADTLHRRPPTGLPFAFVNNYGPTECTVVATSGVVMPDGPAGSNGAKVNDAASIQPSIGRPINGTEALILDDDLKPVAAGEAGELCLSGAHVGRGYRNDPVLTASRFKTIVAETGFARRIYRTGDRARLLADGQIAFLGRVDEQVKVRGYRIELGEIVAALNRYPGIEASVVVLTSATKEPALVAYVVSAAEKRPTASDLREFLAARLPDYMIPLSFVALDHLPLTPNGKLDKSALPQPSAANLLPIGATDNSPAMNPSSAAASSAAAPRADGADLQERIAGMVASLLGQPSVAPQDNFFMIGGHSMFGVQLVARIRDTFGVKLTLRQLFGAPTVAALSAQIAGLLPPHDGPTTAK